MNKFFCLFLFLTSFALAEDFIIEMRSTPIIDAIRFLSYMENKNIVVPEGIEGTVTASFPKTSLSAALDVILASKDLGKIEENNVIRIATKKALEERGEDLVKSSVTLKFGKASEVKAQISSLLSSRGSILIDSRTNMLTIRDNPQNLNIILSLIESMDQKDRQVLIEAKIIEASVDFTRGLGIDWGMSFSQGIVSLNRINPSNTSTLNLGVTPMANMDLDFAITAAESEGKVNIISRPSIVTLNNQAASIKSGLKFYVKIPGSLNIANSSGSVPSEQSSSSSVSSSISSVPSSSTTSSSSTANLREIESGISMTVTPQITGDDKISLSINVSQSQPNIAKTVDGIPSVQDNTASTVVTLEDGQTTVIGGLFQSQDSSSEQGLPFFRNIPILGPILFGTQSKSKLKKELLIFIKPSIVKNHESTDKLLDHVDLVKDKLNDKNNDKNNSKNSDQDSKK